MGGGRAQLGGLVPPSPGAAEVHLSLGISSKSRGGHMGGPPHLQGSSAALSLGGPFEAFPGGVLQPGPCLKGAQAGGPPSGSSFGGRLPEDPNLGVQDQAQSGWVPHLQPGPLLGGPSLPPQLRQGGLHEGPGFFGRGSPEAPVLRVHHHAQPEWGSPPVGGGLQVQLEGGSRSN